MPYKPEPIDNSKIELSEPLKNLVEKLAANNHELWARGRVAEGWKYGPERDLDAKLTPQLVPYDELPESEREYDRVMAVETLKTIQALGWTIQDPGQPKLAAHSLQEFQQDAKRANSNGEALMVFDIANEGLKFWPKDARLRQAKALALARMGSREAAREMLLELQKESPGDPETLGLLARTDKDHWLSTGDSHDLDRAYESYARAFQAAPDSYWVGINAATLAFLRGDGAAARALASKIRNFCVAKLQDATEDAYWINATIAEAALLMNSLAEAEQFYARASRLGEKRIGDVVATWRNAHLIVQLLPPDVDDRVRRVLQVPRVAVFAGHRIDAPGRSQPRFPESSAESVKKRIHDHLIETQARFGYSSAASGADILFLEAMQAVGGKTYLVLPCDEDLFIKESVASSGDHWVSRFHAVKAQATEVIVASRERLNVGSVGYVFANDLIHGLANLRARQDDLELTYLAVWEGQPSGLRGGTADIVQRWEQRGADVIVVRPLASDIVAHPGDPLSPSPGQQPASAAFLPGFGSGVRAMLFADAHHFSQLSEDQMPVFIQHFMGSIAMLVRQTQPRPLFQNTWGDGLFMTFAHVPEAGRFALKLLERVAQIDRDCLGLPPTLTLRISLHAGPVYQYKDQIIDKLNYIGSHVNRTARMEPVTQPGQIYVSDAFAALAELEAPGQFHFDYVGKLALDKKFGEYRAYRMQLGGL